MRYKMEREHLNIGCWILSLALAGCAGGGMVPADDPSLTESQKNLAAIRAILAQPPYASTGVPAENVPPGSAHRVTWWPPEWLTGFVSPGPVEQSTTAPSFVPRPAAFS